MSIQQKNQDELPTQSSLGTIFQLCNSMVGSAAIVLPVLYFNLGIGNALIISSVIALISLKSSQLLILHNNQDEIDLPDTLLRVLGKKWSQFYIIITLFTLFSCALIAIILSCQMIYPIVALLYPSIPSEVPINILKNLKSDFIFSQISYQWIGIFYTLMMVPIVILQNIDPILKLLQYGVISIVFSILFIIFKGAQNIHPLKMFENKFITLAGIFQLGFQVQTLIIPITKKNKYSNNKRDVTIAYILTYIIFSIIGIFGSFAMIGTSPRPGTNGATILDFFDNDDYLAISLQVLIFAQLMTLFPVILFVSRQRFFQLLEIDSQVWHKRLFSLVYLVACLLFQMFNADLSEIISISGACLGYFLVFVIPIVLHLKALQKQKTFDLLSEEESDQMTIENKKEMENKKNNEVGRYIVYGALLILGLVLGVLKLIQQFGVIDL